MTVTHPVNILVCTCVMGTPKQKVIIGRASSVCQYARHQVQKPTAKKSKLGASMGMLMLMEFGTNCPRINAHR